MLIYDHATGSCIESSLTFSEQVANCQVVDLLYKKFPNFKSVWFSKDTMEQIKNQLSQDRESENTVFINTVD